MNPIPDSVNELMWLLAEQGEPSAIESFSLRYPEHRGELLSRIKMVRGIKSARQIVPAPVATNTFQPSANVADPAPNWIPFASGIGLACVGLLAYLIASMNTRVPIVGVQTQPTAVVQTQPQPQLPQDLERVRGDIKEIEKPEAPPLGANDVQPIRPKEVVDLMTKPITLKADETRLINVLNEISIQSGVAFQLAPGLSNDPVTGTFEAKPVKDVLAELAVAMNFSFFEQEPGKVLILPVGQNPQN